jgi:uncharacterized protein HemX
MEVAVAAVVASALAAGTASYSQGQQEKRMAKTARRNQDKAIAEEKAAALETRKGQVDQQRAMMGATGRGTRGTSSTGVRATIGGTTDTLG